MGQHRAPGRRSLFTLAGDAVWAVRYAVTGTSRRVWLVAAAAAAALVVAALVWFVAAGPSLTPATPRAKVAVPAATPTSVAPADPLDKLGVRTGSQAQDGPKCEKAARHLAKVAKGKRAAEVTVAVRQDVAFQAQVIGSFCTPQRAAQVNDELLEPFFAQD